MLLACSCSQKPVPNFRIVHKVDVQKLGVMDWFKAKHQGQFLYYLAPVGEKYVLNSMIQSSNLKETYRLPDWANEGDLVYLSDF